MTKKYLILFFALVLLFSCKPQQDTGANHHVNYFDLKGYFDRESQRLQKLNPEVFKSVAINGRVESKKVMIRDWNKELAIFKDADINKTSWAGSFTADTAGHQLSYRSDHPKIPVKELIVLKTDTKVKAIQVVIQNKNILFRSSDTLSYYPDSLYQVKKRQKIRLLTEKTYQITGKLK